MILEDFIKKYKITRMYKYAQAPRSSKEIEFGWADSSELDLSQPIIITSASKSKELSPAEVAWSEREGGANAASLDEYLKYFKALVGSSPEEFLTKWDSKEQEFIQHWQQIHPNYKIESADWIIGIAKLICKDQKFTQFGRIFKKINPST